MTRYLLLFDSYGFVFVRRPLWREDGSVFRICCLSTPTWVRVPWDPWPYFTLSDLRLLFSSPPTTSRVTVQVFDPASTYLRSSLCNLGEDPQKTPSLNNRSIVGRCRGNVFTEQLPSNGLLLTSLFRFSCVMSEYILPVLAFDVHKCA
jgi:hypothetical protein